MSRIERDTQRRKLPLIGRIKCGERIKNKDGKEISQSLDYFKATGNYAHFFHNTYGDKPNKISIVFISDNTDISCDERQEIRKGSKLYAFGNGHKFFVYDEKIDNYIEKTLDQHPNLIEELEKKCLAPFEEVLTLRFIVLGVKEVFGFWQLTTKAESSSIPQIVAVFDMVQEMAGTVRNIPFDLVIDKVKSQKPESKASFPVISLIPNVSKENLDRVGELISSGMKISGLLTENRINQFNLPQIENKGTTIEVENKIDNPFAEPDSEKLKEAISILRSCKSNQDMTQAIKKVMELGLSQNEKKKANIVRLEMLEAFK